LLRASLASLRYWGALASRTLAARFCFFLCASGTGSNSLFFFRGPLAPSDRQTLAGGTAAYWRSVPPCSVDGHGDERQTTPLLLKAYDGEFSQERGIALPTRAKHFSHDG
jgi:hypothetical protein